MSNKLEKVREIILKQYYQNNDKRFAELETKISEGFTGISKQIEGLNDHFKTEIADIKSKIYKDKTERQDLFSKVKYVTDELSRKETRILKEVATLDRKLNHNNLNFENDISLLKKKLVNDISNVFNKISIESIKLESKLTDMIKHELTETNRKATQKTNQKQKSEFDKIETHMRVLKKEIETLSKEQEKLKKGKIKNTQ